MYVILGQDLGMKSYMSKFNAQKKRRAASNHPDID